MGFCRPTADCFHLLNSSPVPMDVRLEVVHDKSRVRDVPLRRDTVVGRGKECQLRIPVADVSRRHCQFTLDGERILIRDLGSSNGTQIADRTIPTGKDVLLSDGDTVTVGPVKFIVHISTGSGTFSADHVTDFDPTADLDDTAEFPSFEELADELTDHVTDALPGASDPVIDAVPDAAQPTRPSPNDLPVANALEGDDSQSDDESSVIDLELDTTDETEPFDVEEIGNEPTDTDSADSDPDSAPDDTEDPPLKSRSLFGLFRRRRRDLEDAEVNDDDLMEEPGEDPPTDMVPSDDGTVGAAQQAQLDAVSVETSEQTPVEDDPANDSVFDDEIPTDQLADTSAGFAADIEPDPADNDNQVNNQDFVDDDKDDDNLMDFLGQFGD